MELVKALEKEVTVRLVMVGGEKGYHASGQENYLAPPYLKSKIWRPQRDLNPCCRLERPAS